jgi:hypothetical protein
MYSSKWSKLNYGQSVQATVVESKLSPVAPKQAAPSSRSYGTKKLIAKPVDSTITLKPDVPSDHLKDADKLSMETFTPDTSFGASHLVSRALF